MERRNSPRIQVSFIVPLAFSGGRTLGEGRLANLSQQGCTVESSYRVQAGGFLVLRMYSPTGYPPIVAQTVVRWSWQGNFGVEFVNMDNEDHNRLRRFLRLLEMQRSTLIPDTSR